MATRARLRPMGTITPPVTDWDDKVTLVRRKSPRAITEPIPDDWDDEQAFATTASADGVRHGS